MQVSLDKIEATTRKALVRHGAADWVATEVARAVTEAEANCNRICGLYYLESYCQQLVSGRVKGNVEPAVSRPRPGWVAVDARFGFAQAAFARGLPAALKAVRETGIAIMAVGHAHTCTALGFFTGQIARAGMIGMGFTNATPIVAPPGGANRVLGTNPMAFSVPDGSGGVAVQFDFSTSAVALGKITMAKAAGQPIPEGWAVDSEGQPTTEPEAALAGALVSAGGYKGWGLGLMVELLAAGLTGSLNSLDVAPLKAPEGGPHDLGQSYILIDPDMAPDFAAKLARVSEAVESDPGARLPGANAEKTDPADLDPALWDAVRALAGEAG